MKHHDYVQDAVHKVGQHANVRQRVEAGFSASQTHLSASLNHAETLGSAKEAVAYIREGMAAWSQHRQELVDKVVGH